MGLAGRDTETSSSGRRLQQDVVPHPTTARASRHAGGLLATLPLGWLAGVACQLQQRDAWPLSAYVACSAIAMVIAIGIVIAVRLPKVRGPAHLAIVAGFMASALIAFGATGVRVSWRLGEVLDAALEGPTTEVVGVVAGLPQRGTDGPRFRFDVESARFAGHSVTLPSTLSLGWYRGQREDASATPPWGELRAGQRWRFGLRLKRPHGNLNPFGFDYELNLFEQGVGATGYVHDASPLLMDRAAGHPIERLRQHVRDAIDVAVPDARAAGVLAALSVGDQSAIVVHDIKVVKNSRP